MRKVLSIIAALTLSVGLWAQSVGDKFVDETSGLKFEITAVGETNTVKVIANHYSGTSYTVPATVSYQSVTFNVTEIGYSAFVYCSGLTSVTIGNSVTTIGEMAFADCSGFTSVTIPNSVTTIGNGAFFDCVSLQSVTLSEGLITIGEMAFSMTGLTSITIPASVTEIGIYAFYASSALTSVTFLGNACQNAIGGGAFDSVGDPDPALLTLPNSWTGTLPDEDGNWYGGKFELSEVPTALINVNTTTNANKFLHNGQLIIRKGDKHINALGQEVR